MSEEIDFNIKNIFDATSANGALKQHGAKKYYIAPYQRGYKWAARSQDDAVCVLIKDLIDASKKPDIEYHLQFITTKISKIGNGEYTESVLEVIDGQQRLTTLTILLSVLKHLDGYEEEAVSNDLLSYEIRPKVTEFFQNHIYRNINTLMSGTWESFIEKYPENNEQDIYYLYSAAQKIEEMLKEMSGKENSDIKDAIVDFKRYLLEKVRIILICIKRNIDCEEIFSNLNDNKIELTSSELIKGLILTDVAREPPNTKRTFTDKEKNELRTVMGRQWDEISHWANRKEIKKFLFSGCVNVLDELLLLLATDIGNEFKKPGDISSKNAVFNYFQSQIKDGKRNARDIFDKLKEIKAVLNDWFNDDEIYNSLGYVFFRRNSKQKIADYLSIIRYGKLKLKNSLNKSICKSLIEDVDTLQYGKDSDKIRDILLAISVFSEDIQKRFDYAGFNAETWSLEHIFPQTPDNLANDVEQKDIDLLKSLCGDLWCGHGLCEFEKVKDSLMGYEETIADIESAYRSLSEKLNMEACKFTSDEKKILYKILEKIGKLDSIGNMALLTGPDNSSNSNGMFDKKRLNIVKRISGGSFVPKHTYDVFSKLISPQMTPDLTIWTINDIDAHTGWIINEIEKIRERKTYEP
jgi:hypothetical protein